MRPIGLNTNRNDEAVSAPKGLNRDERRRVVVTGVGWVSPVGIGTDETWSAICGGRSGIAPITLFATEGYSTRFAGEVKNFSPENYVDRNEIKKIGLALG